MLEEQQKLVKKIESSLGRGNPIVEHFKKTIIKPEAIKFTPGYQSRPHHTQATSRRESVQPEPERLDFARQSVEAIKPVLQSSKIAIVKRRLQPLQTSQKLIVRSGSQPEIPSPDMLDREERKDGSIDQLEESPTWQQRLQEKNFIQPFGDKSEKKPAAPKPRVQKGQMKQLSLFGTNTLAVPSGQQSVRSSRRTLSNNPISTGRKAGHSSVDRMSAPSS